MATDLTASSPPIILEASWADILQRWAQVQKSNFAAQKSKRHSVQGDTDSGTRRLGSVKKLTQKLAVARFHWSNEASFLIWRKVSELLLAQAALSSAFWQQALLLEFSKFAGWPALPSDGTKDEGQLAACLPGSLDEARVARWARVPPSTKSKP